MGEGLNPSSKSPSRAQGSDVSAKNALFWCLPSRKKQRRPSARHMGGAGLGRAGRGGGGVLFSSRCIRLAERVSTATADFVGDGCMRVLLLLAWANSGSLPAVLVYCSITHATAKYYCSCILTDDILQHWLTCILIFSWHGEVVTS